MTSLAQQLQRLAVPEARAAAAVQGKERKSLLFDPAEAAGLDRDTFYAIGVNGLQELAGIDPSFLDFEALLFDEASKALERSVQSKEVNAKLDKKIRRFLLCLSPYFLLKPAQKAIEWLVHRFHIHEYNMDELLMCVLPYHETKVFVRAVQLLNIRDAKHKWNWLEPIQKPGVSLSRLALVNHCISDPGFLHFVCELPVLAIKAHKKTSAVLDGDRPASDAPLRIFFSFYATAIVSAISSIPKMRENFLATLVPFLLRGLKQGYPDFNGATYMVICQLTVSATLKTSLLEPLMEAMCQYARPGMLHQMLGCLAVMCRTQNLKQLPGKVLFQLCATPQFLISLTQLSETHNITPLLSALLPHLTATAVHAEISGTGAFPEGCGEVDYTAMLSAVLRDIQVESQIAVATAKCLLHEYVTACCGDVDNEVKGQIREKLAPLVQALERKFPEAMDLILQSYVSEVDDEEKQQYVQEFISMSSGSTKHQLLPESNTSLVLSLNHANPEVRKMAVNHVRGLIKQGQKVDSFLQESLVQRLQDDSLQVINAVLKLEEYVCEVLPVQEVFDALKKLIKKWKRKTGNEWKDAMKGALNVITSCTFLSKARHLADEAVAMVIPHLFTTGPASSDFEREMGALVAESFLAQVHPVFKGIKPVLASKRANDDRMVTAQVLDLLSKNIAGLIDGGQQKIVHTLLAHVDDCSKPEAFSVVMTTILLRALQRCEKSENKVTMAMKLLELLEVDAKKMCVKNVQLTRPKQRGYGEEMEWQDDSLKPIAVSSDELPPLLHNHLAALFTAKKKHRVAGVVYLHSSQVQTVLWALESLVLSLQQLVQSANLDTAWPMPGSAEGHLEGQFVTLMLKVIDILTQGAADCKLKDIPRSSFRKILTIVIKDLFGDPLGFVKLLSSSWFGHVISSQPIGYQTSPVFQVRCINMAATVISSMPEDSVTSLVQKDCTVIPSLLLTLASPLQPVRGVAVQCLQAIRDRCHDNADSPYDWLLQRLLKKREALTLDAEYVKHVLGTLLMKANIVPAVPKSPSKRRREKSPDSKAASAMQAKNCLEWVLELVQKSNVPHQVQRALLELLQQVDSEIVLSSLYGLLSDFLSVTKPDEGVLDTDQTTSLQCILSHVTPLTANRMSDQHCLDLFLEALGRERPACGGKASPQSMVLQQMTSGFYSALPSTDVQQTLLSSLIDLQVDTNSSATANQISKVIKKLPLTAGQIVTELSKINSGQKPKSVKEVRKARQKQKQASSEEASQQDSSSEGRPWQRVTAILEVLQQRKLGKMEDLHALVPSLFNILSMCLELSQTEQGSTEYVKQLLLTTILTACDQLDTKGSDAMEKLTEEQFSVELVVQCIRTSDNPQTHNHALLLLATAAKLFPEHVLHNIMAIFTFMGASLLRQDDSHSFQVIHNTVQTVIPALVKASKDQSLPSSLADNLEDVVTMVMQTFVDAFPHIPEHRRLPLFTHLVQSVGGAEYLWRVVLLLIGGYATKGGVAMLPEDTKTKGPGRNLEFWLALCHHFDPQTQVTSLVKMLAYMSTLKEQKEAPKTPSHATRSARHGGGDKGSKVTKDLIFDPGQHSPRQLRQFKFTAVGFMSQLLTSHAFIGQLVNQTDAESADMQDLYQNLLEQTLCYITHVAHCIQENTDPITAKFWRALLHKAYDVLDKVNSLLPAEVFIKVVSGLLGNQLSAVRRKAMELLNNKLIQNKEGFEKEEVTMLLGMVPTLVVIAQSSRERQPVSEELDVNRQTALYSLKLLCKLFGSDHHKKFVVVMDLALSVITETQGNNQVIASGLLCLGEAVRCLRAHAIPYLSRFMPSLLDILASKTNVISSDLHLLSAVTALQKVLETLPHFLSPYLGQLLQQVCRLSAARQDEEKAQMTLRLKSCRHQLSTALPPRVLIPSLADTYKLIHSTSQTSIGPLMSILSDHLDHLSKEDLLSHHHAIVNLFLTALDYRSVHSEVSLQVASDIEGHVIDAVISMVMKLSEATFRPMFLKLYEWGTQSESKDRLLTFYRLSDSIADKLKSLFTLFAGHLVANLASILDGNNVIKTDEAFFSDIKPVSDEKSALLLGYTMDCLHKCFLYDKGDFVSKERFEKLMQPLVDQVENALGGDEMYQDRITAHLTPCIVQFMVAARDPSTWQPLNYQVLLKTRNSLAKVRYAALTILQSIHNQLGEDYLSLLPETIPFLAELMEDESEEVEQHCQDVVAELEKTLGEPLQKYF